jgi:hypothetical protein
MEAGCTGHTKETHSKGVRSSAECSPSPAARQQADARRAAPACGAGRCAAAAAGGWGLRRSKRAPRPVRSRACGQTLFTCSSRRRSSSMRGRSALGTGAQRSASAGRLTVREAPQFLACIEGKGSCAQEAGMLAPGALFIRGTGEVHRAARGVLGHRAPGGRLMARSSGRCKVGTWRCGSSRSAPTCMRTSAGVGSSPAAPAGPGGGASAMPDAMRGRRSARGSDSSGTPLAGCAASSLRFCACRRG